MNISIKLQAAHLWVRTPSTEWVEVLDIVDYQLGSRDLIEVMPSGDVYCNGKLIFEGSKIQGDNVYKIGKNGLDSIIPPVV